MRPAAQASPELLKKKLDALQCHFTWKLDVDSFSPRHLLQKLHVEMNHTAHQNQVALLGLQAYLLQLNNQSFQALESLKNAEKHKEGNHLASTASSLITYGNYAWIYYLQGSYQETETCLQRLQGFCPSPWDACLIPYIQAQKGWSLLVIRARNGERARECFNVALMLEPENSSFCTGLAMALYSSWNFSWQPDIEGEARVQFERIVKEQPNNYRAKIYLAKLLRQVDRERSIALVEECAENSSDPEVLKLSVLFWMPVSAEQALKITQRALQQYPGYPPLYQALANCYRQLWLKANGRDKNKIRCKAIKDLQEIIQRNPDCDLTLVKLQFAELVGVKKPAQEERIYEELQERIDTLSLRSRQALNLFWGDFFLSREKCQDRAKAKFMDCYRIPVQTEQRRCCGRRLLTMAEAYQQHGDADAAGAIHRFLQEADLHLPREPAVLGLDDEDHPVPQRGEHGFSQG